MLEPTEVGEAYDSVSPIIDELTNGQFHLWYWYDDEDDTPLPEAMQRITRKAKDTLALRPGERVLDAGSGCGGPAILLATEADVDVTGITISRVQVAESRARAAASGVSHRAHFHHGDYMRLGFPNESFDAVLAMESLQCAPDLSNALHEFYRVLRGGGRIVVTDFTREPLMDERQAAQFASSININIPPTLGGWLEALKGAGFLLEEYTQCGPRVFGNRKWKYHESVANRREDLIKKFGENATAEFDQGVRMFFEPAAEHLGYVIVTASRPRDR